MIALSPISTGYAVLIYGGEVHSSQPMETRYCYVHTRLGVTVYLDGSRFGTLGRFINHSCEPNCRMDFRICDHKLCPFLVADRDIGRREYLSLDYGETFQLETCLCGSTYCITHAKSESWQLSLMEDFSDIPVFLPPREEAVSRLLQACHAPGDEAARRYHERQHVWPQ